MEINIKVNGNVEVVSVNKSVYDLVTGKNLDPTRVVVEVNQRIIKRDQFRELILQDGDVVEVLRFVGGG